MFAQIAEPYSHFKVFAVAVVVPTLALPRPVAPPKLNSVLVVIPVEGWPPIAHAEVLCEVSISVPPTSEVPSLLGLAVEVELVNRVGGVGVGIVVTAWHRIPRQEPASDWVVEPGPHEGQSAE